jgi:hypothetical protein
MLPLLLIAGCAVFAYLGWLWTRPQGELLTGSVTIYYFNELNPYTGGGCTPEKAGPGEFADLKPGTPVVVTDASGAELAETGLAGGSDMLSTCRFRFAVGPLDEADSYTIKVGERVPVTFTHEELVLRNWDIAFDYGGQVQEP